MEDFITSFRSLPEPKFWKPQKVWRIRLLGKVDGKPREKTFYGKTPEVATRKAKAFLDLHHGWDEASFCDFTSFGEMPLAVRHTHRRCEHNARLRKINFDLSKEDFVALFNRAGGRCEFSGVPFSYKVFGPKNRRPFAPSIDRVDSTDGYTLGNSRAVCLLVNYANGTWGSEPLRMLIDFMKNHEHR